MKVLVAGAASRVARGAIQTLEKAFDLRLLDVNKSENFPEREWAVGSILDGGFLKQALHGMEAVVNFVTVRDVPTEEHFDVNVKGQYMLLEAAEESRVRRFVHVSSTATIIGHWYDGAQAITVDSPYTTRGRYSLCKMLQERMCEHRARNGEMRIVVLRPWEPCEGLTRVNDSGAETPRQYSPGLIDSREFGEACRLAVEAEDLGRFEVFHTVATQEARERFDSERTARLLGFEAKEDFGSLLE